MLCSSLGVFHYFGVAKASQDAPQDGAKLELVMGSILEGFSIDFGRFQGGQNAPKMVPDAPWTVQDGPKLDLVLGSILDRFGEVFLEVLGTSWG